MSSQNAAVGNGAGDDGRITRQQWKWSVLAGMASYLDAGSIVALSTGLALWKSEFGLSSGALGALAAIGPNAIGCAIGAFIGGRLGDQLGRKRIYKWDLLVYAFGTMLIALAVNPPMLFIGTFIVGVAVGADVPTSLALVSEFSPSRGRGKLLGLTQIAWNLGPVIVLVMAFALASLGVLGVRLVFVQLFVAAIITWALRRGMVESARWRTASDAASSTSRQVRNLFSGANLRALVWTGTVYLFWNIAAGTKGIFDPYLVNSLGAGDQATSVALAAGGFLIGIIAVGALFMPFVDRSYRVRRTLWALGALMQIFAFVPFLFLPFTVPVIIMNVVLFAVGAALAGETFYKVFSQELFPTVLRGTAQGLTFGVARVALGLWSFVVPLLAETGIVPVATLLMLFLIVSGTVGFFFMPDTVGKSLEQIEVERGAATHSRGATRDRSKA